MMKKIILFFLVFTSLIFSSTEEEHANCACYGFWQSVSNNTYPDEIMTNTFQDSSANDSHVHSYYCFHDDYRSTDFTDTIWIQKELVTDTSHVYDVITSRSDSRDNCVPNPTCDDNQTLDTSVNPPVCVDNTPTCPANQIYYNGVCTSCPTNAHKVDATTCACDLGGTPDGNGACPIPQCNDLEYYNPPTDRCEQCDCANSCHYDASASLGYVCEAGDTGDDTTDNNDTGGSSDNNDTGGSSDNNDTGDDTSVGTTDDNDCVHPPGTPTNKFFGYCFSTIVNDPYNCNETYQLQNCSEGAFACYTECPNPDTNQTDNNDTGGSSDNNDDGSSGGTAGDSNNSVDIDTSVIETKLDAIAASLGVDGQLNKSLADLGNLINTTNNNLGSKLDDIGSKLDDQFNYMSNTNGVPTSDNAVQTDENTLNQMNNVSNQANQAVSTMSGTLNNLITSFTGTSPTVSGTGSHVFTANVFGGTVNFDLSMFEDMKSYFDILWVLLLAYLNFKIYALIIRDLLKKL